ncbi:MAG TPA: allophanate hydrolase subunit 1 [Gammaproteobacteria bacterium]|jgi:KipI family sensor histidine kinase inhibitor|nr:allophanate hydrolase subunit 1 [Gammaproteobacteria bacterium]
MNIRLLGDSALLVELPDFKVAQALRHEICASAWQGILELVPGYNSLLIETDPLKLDVERLATRIQKFATGSLFLPVPNEHEFAVRYDGPDLQAVAEVTGLTIAEVIGRHSASTYTVAFLGFAPGFPYLVGLDPALQVARLKTPRTRVPAGAVAIADQFAGIYPQATPGGWRLLGSTAAKLFDASRDTPALLAPGDRVRFRAMP